MRIILFIFCFSFLVFSCNNTKKDVKNKTKKELVNHHGLDNLMNENNAPFYHGVASGDPTTNTVIIWTRYTPKYHQNYSIDWEVSLQNDFSSIVQQGKFETNQERDYTVKVDVQNLEPGTTYYYRFKNGKDISPVGRTQTISTNPDKIKLAFASCSNYAWGYFNAYRMIGDDSLDVVIHLGDYIYEHEPGIYEANILGRQHIPSKELITIDDYRTRYAQYRLDEDLKYVHAMHPFITIWDDHELANNAYNDGAGNHQENEGDWQVRLAAAKKAYYEWMPIRENNGHHYRSFKFGDLANLIMLDTRTEERTKQPEKVDINDLDTSKHIINKTQMIWLENELNKDVVWKIIGNQILFSDMLVFFSQTPQLYNDGWSAYKKNQYEIFNEIRKTPGVIVVTGDFHSSFAIKNKNFYEYVIPSITSANYDEEVGKDSALIYENWYRKENNDLGYVNLSDHGYFVLELSKATAMAHFVFCEDVKTPNTKLKEKITFGFRSFRFLDEN